MIKIEKIYKIIIKEDMVIIDNKKLNYKKNDCRYLENIIFFIKKNLFLKKNDKLLLK